jgi:hypothetical protein
LRAKVAHRRAAGRRLPGGDLVLGRFCFQLLELQFQLIEQAPTALCRLPKALAFHLGNQQLEVRHHGLGGGGPGLGLLPRHTLGRQCGLQRGEIIVGVDCGRRHEPDYRRATPAVLGSTIG